MRASYYRARAPRDDTDDLYPYAVQRTTRGTWLVQNLITSAQLGEYSNYRAGQQAVAAERARIDESVAGYV